MAFPLYPESIELQDDQCLTFYNILNDSLIIATVIWPVQFRIFIRTICDTWELRVSDQTTIAEVREKIAEMGHQAGTVQLKIWVTLLTL